MRTQDQDGVVLLSLAMMLVPLLLVTTTFSALMTTRSNELAMDLDRDRALLAAESGIDEAIYRAKIGSLADGVTISRDLSGGMSFSVEPTHLLKDGRDNDGDGIVDDIDEDIYQIICTGTYRTAKRRVASYLGPVGLLPTLDAAINVTNPGIQIDLKGTSLVSGLDVNMDGSTGPTNGWGLAIESPGTVSHLDAELDSSEEAQVDGQGGAPSLGASGTIDFPALSATLENVADTVLTGDKYSRLVAGTRSQPSITYRNGDVRISGNSTGAGILIVNGDLIIAGTFRFDGIVLVAGNIEKAAGTADIYGSVVTGPATKQILATGTLNVRYSTEAIALANSASGRFVTYNGWQELGGS